MKIDFNRASLAAAIGNVQAVIPSSTPKTILYSVLLEVSSGKAAITATDTEISIRHEIPGVECNGGESILLPARRISDVLRELKDERVTLFVDGKNLQLKSERSKFNIPTEDPSGFPAFHAPENSADYTLPGNMLKKMIRRTVFATDQKGTLPVFGGVLFEVAEQLTLVSTDKRRMPLIHAPVQISGKQTFKNFPVVPAKALSLLERTIPDSEDVVHIAFNDSQATFRTEHATITSRLIEGRFPRWKDVVPRSHEISVDVLVGSLHGVIRQSLIFTNEITCGVDFQFTAGNLKLKSQASEVGDSEVELPIGYDGDPMTVRLDPRYISEFLKTLPSESQVNLKIVDSESPVTLTTDDGSTYVVMSIFEE